jgi:hypothetical protein
LNLNKPSAGLAGSALLYLLSILQRGLLFLASLLLFLPTATVAQGNTAPAFVQEKDNQLYIGNKSSVTFSNPTAVGNLIVVYLIWDNKGSASVSDSLGNSYSNASGVALWSSGTYSAQIFYTINLRSGGDTVTATFATAVKSFGLIYAHEYSGISQTAPLDVTASASGSTGSLNSGTATTTNASDLLFAGGVSANVVSAPGPGYTARSRLQGNITEDRLVSAIGPYTATASNIGGAWAMQLVAFKGAASDITVSPPTIITQPSNQVVTAGQTATFSVGASGSAPLSYQWQKNGTPIGANSSNYTTPPTTLSDNGAKFLVLISNSAGSVTSSAATLTVNPPPVTLQSIAVSPTNPSINPSQTQQFTATGTYSDGSSKNITTSVTWASSNPAVATIGATTGLATGVGAGTTQITATLGSVVSPSDTLTVRAITLQSIAVSPVSPSISSSQTLQFIATGAYSDGSSKDITTSVFWKSSSASVAAIGANTGMATGVAAGTSQITATLGSVISPAVTLTVTSAAGNFYATNFSLTENPISEAGKWINGKVTGLDWADVRTTPGLAFGNQTDTGAYEDSTAVLVGIWGPDQTVQATVHTVNQSSSLFEEVELRLRTSITAHSNSGYEINFHCTADGTQYVQIVRWNGRLGDFTGLNGGAGPGLHNGDVVTATIVGSTLSAYINGQLIVQATDSTFTSGSPGIGFYFAGGDTSQQSDFGFSSFSASDGGKADPIPPSVPANLAANIISASEIDLSWSASTDNVAVVGYHVFRNNTQIATAATPGFADQTVVPGIQYAYTVSAFDAARNEFAQSLTVYAQTSPGPDLSPPTPPANLQSSNVTATSLTLSWSASTDNVGVSGYQVFRNGTQVGTTKAITFADTQLVASTTYVYTVAAYDGSGNVSAPSQPLTVTTAAAALNPPTFVQVNNNQIQIGASTSVAFNTPTQPGNTIVVYVIWSNTGTVLLSDSSGNTFVNVGAPVSWGTGYSAQVFYATHIGGGPDTVTASFRTPVSSFGLVYVHEYAGIDSTNPVDVTISASGSSAMLNSGSAITTSPNDLIFGAGVSDNTVTAPGSGFLSRDLTYGNITEDRIATSVGSYSATAPHYGNMWGMQMVAFRAATTGTPAIAVTVSPKAATVVTGLTQQFVATVANSSNTAVTWQVNGVTGGNSTVGTISVGGLYKAPTIVPSGAVTVGAIAQADNTKSDTATVTVTTAPVISVTVSPATPAVAVGTTQQFTATVTNTSNPAVTWQVNGVTGGDSMHGTINASGLFTAPAAVPSPATVTVTAISQADNTKSGSAVVTITAVSSLTVTVSPKRVAITTGQTQTFIPTVTGSSNISVTWEVDSFPGGNATVGTITAGGVYTPSNSGGVHNVVARSVANTSATSAASTIAVTDLPGVFTYHNNNSRDGVNTKEYALTTSTVSSSTFGKLFSCNMDGAVYSQPLWVANLMINGAKHNVILAVSMRDTVYLFDADASPCVTYWSKSLLPTGEIYVSNGDVSSADIFPDIGILGTPVIDPSTNAVFLVAKSKTTPGTPTFKQRLHALNLVDGSERTNSPLDLTSSITYPGNADIGNGTCPNTGGASPAVTFCASRLNQRAGLALVNGTVYIVWASHGDVQPYHGWVLGFNATTLAQNGAFNASPNGREGGIWMSGGAPAADSSNNLYMITGNGDWDGVTEFGDSIIKLNPSGLTVSDWFTPAGQASLDSGDLDFGSGGAVVLVDVPTSPNPHLLIGGGKGSAFNGELYVINRDNLGHLVSGDTQVIQKIVVGGGIFATEAYWQNTIYIAGTNTPLKAYALNTTSGLFNTSTVPQSPTSYGFPGATPSVSSSGATNGIVWTIQITNYGTRNGNSQAATPAVLHAYDASNIATELWNSSMSASDTAGNSVKFTVPTIANGKVYVPTRGDDTTTNSPTNRGRIDVYGLKPN